MDERSGDGPGTPKDMVAKKVGQKDDGTTWFESFVADGTANGFDAKNPDYSILSWQIGSLSAWTASPGQRNAFWIADT